MSKKPVRIIENHSVCLNISLSESMDSNYNARKNFGYAALSKIYHELEIDSFLKNRQRHTKEDYDANAIMKLLVFSRLLYPSSKKKTFENKEIFFEKQISLLMIYIDAFPFLTNIKIHCSYGCTNTLKSSTTATQNWSTMT